MLIKNTPSWHLPESLATPEDMFFNRRGIVKTAGALALGSVLASCNNSPAPAQSAKPGNGPQTVADPSASLYPFKRNTAYTLDRAITDEKSATTWNNYYEFGTDKDQPARYAQTLPIRPWEITIDGMVEKPIKTDIDSLIKAMPCEERLYRHRCVETWAMAVPWSGFPMKALVDYAKPLSGAQFVTMVSFVNKAYAIGQQSAYVPWVTWPYVEAVSMAEANNDLAFLVTGVYGKPLPKQNGAPLRIALPWKYGFKSAKGLVRFTFTDKQPKNWWNSISPKEYGFWANVNPQVPHPRWSQATEEVLGTDTRVATKLFNGYAEQVASLYPAGNDPVYYR